MRLSTCKWRNRLAPLTLEQIALAQGSQGLNPVHFINKESGQQENSICRKAYTDAPAGRNASRGFGNQGETAELILRRVRCCQNRDDEEARDESRSLGIYVWMAIARGVQRNSTPSQARGFRKTDQAAWLPQPRLQGSCSAGPQHKGITACQKSLHFSHIFSLKYLFDL